MAAVEIERPPGLQPLFKNLSPMFNPAESEDVVLSLKRNYGGKFNLLENHDLSSSFDLLEKHGHLYDNKLTLIEDFIAPKSNKEELIKQLIESYKASVQARVEPRKELQGRQDEIREITRELENGKSSVVNLFGTAGVGKTTIANEVCSKWRGTHFVFDLREAKDMKAIYLNMMNSLEIAVSIGFLNQNYIVGKIHEKIQDLKSESQPVLFLLDNVEQFTSGHGKEGKNLKISFVQFLEKLSEFKGKEKKTPLKLLLTSRSQLQDAKTVENFEIKPLGSSFSEKILISKGIASVNTDQKKKLIDISKGKPLLLKGLAAILRQERKSADDLIAGVQKERKSKSEENVKEKPFSFEEEGVDMDELSTIREMFETLPTENLRKSAVSVSLFCGPFSASTAAKILGISVSDAVAQLEGLVTSAIIFVVDEEAKERKYDIHPLLRKYADSIKNDAIFQEAYLQAKRRFHQHFMSKMEKIAKLIEPDYVRAYKLFESDRPNYEFTLDISLLPEYFSVPGEFHENVLIASLFNAMLTEDKQIKLFHSWAEMCEDDGQSGSLCRAQLKSLEARQVLDVDGTEKAFVVLEEASRSLDNVQDKLSESYRLIKGIYLHQEGEAYWFKRDYKRSLESLESSLEFTEKLLKVHTDVAKCYNAIGNCQFHLGKPVEALYFYKIAYHMQEELAGGEYHFDMPMYKNQIATVYENQKDYDKAVQWYRDALKLLDELKLSGFHDEAFFCRNLANALMYQKKYTEAVEPADRAYNIRMKILGNHPLTIRSIFQRAVIQANFGDYKEALKLFLEAWEMEKSVGAGNHSEVWRKIIEGVEDMYDFLVQTKLNVLSVFAKKEFKKDALKFCQRFWEEEKRSAQFGFTEFNKEIIDAVLYLAGDKKDKYEAERDALWFYDGMLSASEVEFQEEFEQETGNSALNEMLKKRDELLDKVIELCLQVADHEKLGKYRNIKLELYQKVLERPNFVGEKDYCYDKATLKDNVEKLYKDYKQKEKIPQFRENLLRIWQKQWEEGKRGEKTKEIGVARERMITGILQVCKELKEKDMFKRYGREALSLYDDTWEEMYAEMEPRAMKKFLSERKELARSIGERERVKIYDQALRDLKKPGKEPVTTLRPKGAQPASKPEEEEEEEEEITVGSEEEEEVQVGLQQEGEVGSMEEIVVASAGVETQAEPETSEVEEDRSFIFEETVTNKGSHWELRKVAAHVIFPPDAVSEDSLITLHRWKPSVCSPPLQENEAIVSDVVELSSQSSEGFGFNKEVTLAISHNAADLKGYEVVMKQLIDRDSNEWVDVDGTVDIRSLSALEKAYGSDFPDYLLPVVETKITQCSTYAVVCRLKAHMFTITSEPATLSLPDFPLVRIVIPQNAVRATEKFHVTVKVQEFTRKEIKNKHMLPGPVLRILCDREIEFQEPVTVQLPLSLRENQDIVLPDLSVVRARILFQQSHGENREWTEITNRLELPPSFDGTVTKFNVRHFSGFWSWVEWLATPVMQMVPHMQAGHSGVRQGDGEQAGGGGGVGVEGGRIGGGGGRGEVAAAAATATVAGTSREGTITSPQPIAGNYNTECVRQAAVFTACVPSDACLHSKTDLSLYCSPNSKRRELIDDEDKFLLKEESALEMMRPNDKAYVSLLGDTVRPDDMEDLEGFFLRFQGPSSMKRILEVHIVTRGDLTIKFFGSQELEKESLLCRLKMKLPPLTRDTDKTPVEFFGVPLNDSYLTDAPLVDILAACKGVLWKIKHREIYDEYYTKSDMKDVTSFFRALARLPPNEQEMCFDEIISFLIDRGGGGVEHIVDRLLCAKVRVEEPANESVRSVVADKLKDGSLWKTLASGLKVKLNILDALEEEEGRDNGQECCRAALKKWYESNYPSATTRKIMIRLTNMGYSNVNWHIMKELNLVAEADMPELERS